jgi:hypothetical protein
MPAMVPRLRRSEKKHSSGDSQRGSFLEARKVGRAFRDDNVKNSARFQNQRQDAGLKAPALHSNLRRSRYRSLDSRAFSLILQRISYRRKKSAKTRK